MSGNLLPGSHLPAARRTPRESRSATGEKRGRSARVQSSQPLWPGASDAMSLLDVASHLEPHQSERRLGTPRSKTLVLA